MFYDREKQIGGSPQAKAAFSEAYKWFFLLRFPIIIPPLYFFV